jgi:hypothetical protein
VEGEVKKHAAVEFSEVPEDPDITPKDSVSRPYSRAKGLPKTPFLQLDGKGLRGISCILLLLKKQKGGFEIA